MRRLFAEAAPSPDGTPLPQAVSAGSDDDMDAVLALSRVRSVANRTTARKALAETRSVFRSLLALARGCAERADDGDASETRPHNGSATRAASTDTQASASSPTDAASNDSMVRRFLAAPIPATGLPPLHTAALAGSAAFVTSLVRSGADAAQAAGPEAFTPLHCAVLGGSAGTVRALIATAAARWQRPALVADWVDRRTASGDTALHLLCRSLWRDAAPPFAAAAPADGGGCDGRDTPNGAADATVLAPPGFASSLRVLQCLLGVEGSAAALIPDAAGLPPLLLLLLAPAAAAPAASLATAQPRSEATGEEVPPLERSSSGGGALARHRQGSSAFSGTFGAMPAGGEFSDDDGTLRNAASIVAASAPLDPAQRRRAAVLAFLNALAQRGDATGAAARAAAAPDALGSTALHHLFGVLPAAVAEAGLAWPAAVAASAPAPDVRLALALVAAECPCEARNALGWRAARLLPPPVAAAFRWYCRARRRARRAAVAGAATGGVARPPTPTTGSGRRLRAGPALTAPAGLFEPSAAAREDYLLTCDDAPEVSAAEIEATAAAAAAAASTERNAAAGSDSDDSSDGGAAVAGRSRACGPSEVADMLEALGFVVERRGEAWAAAEGAARAARAKAAKAAEAAPVAAVVTAREVAPSPLVGGSDGAAASSSLLLPLPWAVALLAVLFAIISAVLPLRA